ncbi:hypothetical protein Tco_1201539 [Tanacetum coccineum]
MSLEYKEHYLSKKEAMHLLLTGIRDEIYSTIDTCKTAHDMWIAIERLQQGESLNIQDVKTNLFWEFGKFISHDGGSMESYYFRFYKMMNEMIRNNLTVATMQVNLFDVLKQYQKKVNEIHAARIAKNANPLALKGKEIAKPITPPSESNFKEDRDPEQAQRDKDMQKNLALIVKYFKKIYKPTNNNLRTSSNSKNKNVDTSSRYKNDNQTGKPKGQKTTLITRKKCCCANKLRKVPIADSGTDTEPLEQVQYDAEYNVFANERQHYEQPGSINNTCVVEKESNTTRDSCLIALQSKQTELETYKTLIDRTVDYDKLGRKLNETLGLLAQKEIDIKEGLKLKACEISVVKEKHYEYGYSKNRKKMVKTGQTQTRDGKECTRAEDLIARKVKSQLQSNLGQESTH